MVVPVRAGLFMVEPEGMQQLVLHSAVVETALTTQRHDLTATRTAHVWPATTDRHSRFLHITNVHFFPSWSENQDGKVAVEQKQNRQKEVRWSEQAGKCVICDQLQWERLPISWLNAQPFTVTALVWSEADTRKPRERLQTTNNDGLLTRGYRHNQDKLRMVARFHLDLDYGILLILYVLFFLCFDFKITLYLL